MNEKQIVEDLLIKAEQGDSEAQNQLGIRYQYGRGVQKNYDEAATYFKLAAAQGNVHAKTNFLQLCKMIGIPAEEIQRLESGIKNTNNPSKTTSSHSPVELSNAQENEINSRDIHNWTPLHYAVDSNNLRVAEFLINHGVNINAPFSFELNPLQIAASKGHLDMVKLLVNQGANIEYHTAGSDYTPLLHATKNNQTEVVKYLVNECYANIHYFAPNGDELNALGLAMIATNEKLITFLLEKGARFEPNPLITMKLKTIPNSNKIYELILTRGYFSQVCDFSQHTLDRCHTFFIRLISSTKNVALKEFLVKKGLRFKIAQLLFEDKNYKGFDPKSFGGWDPYYDVFSSLGLAMVTNNEEWVKLLLQKGAEFIPHDALMDELKSIPNSTHFYKLILTTGHFAQKCNFQGNKLDECHMFFLRAAFPEENEEIMKLLLEKGLDPNLNIDISIQNRKTTTTLLIRAVERGFLKITQLLLEKRADPNLSDQENRTPLLVAVEKGSLALVKFLLEKNADPNKSNEDDETPLKAAEESGNQEILDALKEACNKNTPVFKC